MEVLLGFVSYEQYFILLVEEKGHAKKMEFWEMQTFLVVPTKQDRAYPLQYRSPFVISGCPTSQWSVARAAHCCSGSDEFTCGHALVEGEAGRIYWAFLLSHKPLLNWHHLHWSTLKSLAGMCCWCMECVMDVWNVGDIILHYYCGLKLHLKDVECWLG